MILVNRDEFDSSPSLEQVEVFLPDVWSLAMQEKLEEDVPQSKGGFYNLNDFVNTPCWA